MLESSSINRCARMAELSIYENYSTVYRHLITIQQLVHSKVLNTISKLFYSVLLFLMVPWVALLFVIVQFHDHTIVLPAKSYSDVLFCLLSNQGLRIDRLLVN